MSPCYSNTLALICGTLYACYLRIKSTFRGPCPHESEIFKVGIGIIIITCTLTTKLLKSCTSITLRSTATEAHVTWPCYTQAQSDQLSEALVPMKARFSK